MGFFDRRTVINVNTSVQRVIADDLLPDAVFSGSVQALFGDGDLASHVLESSINGLGVQGERLYRYASQHYTHGMPSGQFRRADEASAEIESVLLSIDPDPSLLIEYSQYAPLNILHVGWMQLLADYGYDPATNRLTVPALPDAETYLADMVVVLPAHMLESLNHESIEQWGTSPRAGYTPARKAGGTIGGLLPHSPVETDAMAASPYLRVEYAYEQFTGDAVTVVTGTFLLGTTQYDFSRDYFHAKYTQGGQTHYWLYLDGAGTYPTLDDYFDVDDPLSGTFFPFTYLRYNKAAVSTAADDPAYRTSKKMLGYLGLDYDQLIEAVNGNPDIDDVEQAMVVMGVPANSSNPVELRYLFDFFDAMHSAVGLHASPTHASILRWLQGHRAEAKVAIPIQDARFQMVLSSSGIFKQRKAGVIGKVGATTFAMEQVQVPYTYQDTLGGMSWSGEQATVTHVYRRQVSDSLYDEIQVGGLALAYYIWNDYTTLGDEADPILLVPLDHSITQGYSLREREILYGRSLHFVFNSLIITRVSWYKSEAFGFIVQVIGMIITLVSFGMDGGAGASAGAAFAAALAAGATMVAIQIAFNLILDYLITLLLVKLFIKVAGPKVAFLAALVAAMAGMTGLLGDGGLMGAPWARELLQVASNLARGVNAELADSLAGLQGEAQAWQDTMQSQLRLLEQAQDLLDTNSHLAPLVVWGETPQDFYQRTVHSGNIGVIGMEAIASYVDVALTLPTLNDTLGRTFYG